MEKLNVEIAVETFYGALRENDVELWGSIFAEGGVLVDPIGTPARHGRSEIQEFLSGVLSLCDKFGVSENYVFVHENTAVVKWTGNGTGKNGCSFTFEGIDIFELNEQGKIQSLKAYWDAEPTLKVLNS